MLRLSNYNTRPLLPFAGSASAGGRPPSPSKRRWGKRVQLYLTPDGAAKLVMLIPLAFIACALIGVIWLLMQPSSSSSDRDLISPASSVQIESSQLTQVRPKPALVAAEAAAEDKDAEVREDAIPSSLPSLIDASIDEVAAAASPPRAAQTPEQASRRWLAHWLSLRVSLDSLSIDLAAFFPVPPAPAPMHLPSSRYQYLPPTSPRPPLQGWAAGMPTFPELFPRDAFVSFLLLFPLPRMASSPSAALGRAGYEGPWDLRPLVGELSGADGAHTDTPRPFPFARMLDAHPSVANTALEDLLRVRTMLRVAALTQGKTADALTGEEPGKIAHQLPGKDVSTPTAPGSIARARNTRFAASDTTALFVLAAVHHFHATGELALLDELLPALFAAYEYMLRHMDASALVIESPSQFLAGGGATPASGVDYALKVTMWKDSLLAKRGAAEGGRGSPAYPVSFILLQAQTLAALRALRSIRRTLDAFTFSQTEPSDMAKLLRRWDSLLARSKQPKIDDVIQRVKGALHTYFFAREVDESSGASTHAAPSPFPQPIPRPAANSCPFFGFDTRGSLGASPVPAGAPRSTSPDTLRTSDPLHALFFLERDDMLPEELAAWFKPAPSGNADEPAPWEPSCFQGLETGLGYATSNMDRRAVSTGGSVLEEASNEDAPRSIMEQRVLSYHHRSVWPFEQALIHSAARRFELAHVENVSRRFFLRFERALLARRKEQPGSPDLFPEFFLPPAFAAKPSAVQEELGFPWTVSAASTRDSAQDADARGEEWVAQGAPTQLWTAASWSYWITQQAQRAQAHAETTDARTPSLLQSARASPCQHDPALVLRGVPADERSRYCPSAVSSAAAPVSPASTPVFPSSVFACLDSSALLWLSAVNDAFCDCADGSDERGTSACAYSDEEHAFSAPVFQCQSRAGVRDAPLHIFASMLDDGVCDCCDGSDEPAGVVQCDNTCANGARPHNRPVQSAWRPAPYVA